MHQQRNLTITFCHTRADTSQLKRTLTPIVPLFKDIYRSWDLLCSYGIHHEIRKELRDSKLKFKRKTETSHDLLHSTSPPPLRPQFMILSTKYGLLSTNTLIAPYNTNDYLHNLTDPTFKRKVADQFLDIYNNVCYYLYEAQPLTITLLLPTEYLTTLELIKWPAHLTKQGRPYYQGIFFVSGPQLLNYRYWLYRQKSGTLRFKRYPEEL